MGQTSHKPQFNLIAVLFALGLAVVAFCFSFSLSGMQNASFMTILEVAAARNLSAFLVGVAAAHLASTLPMSRLQIFTGERWLFLIIAI